jgi:hypothetical protein
MWFQKLMGLNAERRERFDWRTGIKNEAIQPVRNNSGARKINARIRESQIGQRI